MALRLSWALPSRTGWFSIDPSNAAVDKRNKRHFQLESGQLRF